MDVTEVLEAENMVIDIDASQDNLATSRGEYEASREDVVELQQDIVASQDDLEIV